MWTCLGTRAVAIALSCLVIALGLDEQRKRAAGAQPTPFWTESTSGPAPPGQAPDIADLVAHLQPAVVHIRTTHTVRGPQGEGQDSPFDESCGATSATFRNARCHATAWALGF